MKLQTLSSNLAVVALPGKFWSPSDHKCVVTNIFIRVTGFFNGSQFPWNIGFGKLLVIVMAQVWQSQVEAIKQRKLSETGYLAYLLKLKIGAQFMLTANVNIEHRLVNGLVGKTMQFKVVNEVTVIYVKFNDANTGLMTMQSDCLAHQQHWVPIRKYEVSFGLKKNKSQPCIKRTQFDSHYCGHVLFIKCKVWVWMKV